MLAIAAGPFVLLLAPWQQTVRGAGRVVAYAPLDRQQAVEAPISGRVVRWWVQEGSRVAEGDPVFEIADIDPLRIQRLEAQRDALQLKLDAFETQVLQYASIVDNTRDLGQLTVEAATARKEEAMERVSAAEAQVAAVLAELTAAELQVERKRRLVESGAVSDRQLEIAEADFAVAQASVREARAKLDGARADQRSMERDLDRSRVDALAKVSSAEASLAESRSKAADARQKLAELEGDISRQQSQLVTAPRGGVVHRLSGNQGGEIVSAGDPLLTLVPDTSDRAVELWIDGNDIPLVTDGSPVRLQFEGWPAVQFTGWPRAAVGTFGGVVSIVDPTDDGQGRFRALVIPDDVEQWPSPRYLRQGVRAKGWVLLNEVTIGQELWRQLNGFPPVIADEEPEAVARKRLK
ncbi:MAG: secretion protein HlyD [Phycisphaerae bacterium]|nr:secretion protein HlyD [Phycisphaerae bacterium]